MLKFAPEFDITSTSAVIAGAAAALGAEGTLVDDTLTRLRTSELVSDTNIDVVSI